MVKVGFLATLIGILGNALLCALKLAAGLATSSLSLISDGVNSLTDLVSAIAIFVAVRVGSQEADEGHPFGHHRAEPLAALFLAIFAGIAGFEILKQSLSRLWVGHFPASTEMWPLLVLLFSIAVKGAMSLFFLRAGLRINSPALLAASVDSRIDILVSLTALGGYAGASLGWSWLDPVASLLISFFIFRSGYRVAAENLDYLMGKSPDSQLLDELREVVLQIPGVRSLDRLRAHYVGTYIHVEIEIAMDKDLPTYESHRLGEMVRDEIEKHPAIDKAFVHINPA